MYNSLYNNPQRLQMFGKDGDSSKFNKNSNAKEGDNISSLISRAMHNVGRPGDDNPHINGNSSSSSLSYRKGAGIRNSMKPANNTMNRYRKARPGIGTASARMFAALTGGMVSTDFGKVDQWKGLGRSMMSPFGNEMDQAMFNKRLMEEYGSNPSQEQIAEFARNYPYSSDYLKQQKEVAVDKVRNAWNTVVDNMSKVNLNAAAGSDEYRRARMNEAESNRKPREREIGSIGKKN